MSNSDITYKRIRLFESIYMNQLLGMFFAISVGVFIYIMLIYDWSWYVNAVVLYILTACYCWSVKKVLTHYST
jgi:membrane protein implicated in regulation of membrane protease activity